MVFLTFVATFPAGCGREAPEPDPNLPSLPRNFYATDPIDIWIGPTHLRIPWNMIGFTYRSNVLPNTRDTRDITLDLYWPGLTGRKPPPADPAERYVYTELIAYEKPLTIRRETFLQQLKDEARGLEGPVPHAQLPLLEWLSPTAHIPVLYAPLDVFERDVHSDDLPIGGLRLSCPFNGQTEPDQHDCWAGGVVTPHLSFRYRIYRANVAHWLEIQKGMQALVQSFIVTTE